MLYEEQKAQCFLDSVAPCGATLSNKIQGFFLHVTHPLIFSKRVRSEMSFERGKSKWPKATIYFFGGVVYRGGNSERCLKWGGGSH